MVGNIEGFWAGGWAGEMVVGEGAPRGLGKAQQGQLGLLIVIIAHG